LGLAGTSSVFAEGAALAETIPDRLRATAAAATARNRLEIIETP
jgi:hypothetical protein